MVGLVAVGEVPREVLTSVPRRFAHMDFASEPAVGAVKEHMDLLVEAQIGNAQLVMVEGLRAGRTTEEVQNTVSW